MQWKKQGVFLLLSILISSITWGMAGPAEEYRLGMNVILTGPQADSYAPHYEGISLYFRELNQKGGIGGRHVSILPEDDTADVGRAVSNIRKLIEQDRVPAVILSTLSAVYAPAIRTIKEADVPVVVTGVCPRESFPPADPLVFCTSSFGALYDGRFAIDFIKEMGRDVRLATVAAEIPISRSTVEDAAQYAERSGLQVVERVVIPVAAVDYRGFASRIIRSGANWVFAWAPWGIQISPFDALQRLGWRGNYLLWAHPPADEELVRRRSENLFAYGGNALFAENLPIHQEIRKLARTYNARYPAEYLAEGWGAAMILEAALRACGWPCDSRRLQAAMTRVDVNMRGLRGGRLRWTPENHYRTRMHYKVYRWSNREGRVVAMTNWRSVEVK